MILKKPYAFLIKNFKLIHLILTGCAIYLVTVINGMLDYFNKFIDNNIGKLGAVDFFGNTYIFVIILAIVVCIIIIALMKYKKKKYLFYVILIGYFLANALLINYTINGLYQIYVSSLDIKTLLLHRDILKIMSYVQYIFVIMALVRGLGFDIKKFNFVDDLVELDIELDDDEEVELTVGGLEGARGKFNRNIREFKYYYLENRQMINLILVGIVLISGGCYVVNNLLLNPVYKVDDSFMFDNLSFKVINSYVSNIGYDNMKVTSDDNTFVLINININNDGVKKEVNTANFVLEIGNYKFSNHVMTNKFLDLGTIYKGKEIVGNATYMFAFEVPVDKIKDKIYLVLGNDKRVELSPIYLDEIDKSKNYKLTDNLDMSDSFYNTGSLKIDSYKIGDSFDYKYTYVVLEKEYEGNITISSINNTVMNLVIDGIYPSEYNNYSFLNKYGKLKYVIDDKEYVSKVFENKTPTSYRDGLYLVVDKEIKDAKSMWFEITVRNKQYIYKLK